MDRKEFGNGVVKPPSILRFILVISFLLLMGILSHPSFAYADETANNPLQAASLTHSGFSQDAAVDDEGITSPAPDIDIVGPRLQVQAIGETQSYTFDQLTYYQTDARSMLADINSFRASNAWCWNSDNSTKSYAGVLSPLSIDYNLEQAAMQRAMEIAIRFSHTRPNGDGCSTVYADLGLTAPSSRGENIAAGYRGAASAFEGWKEENEDYSGQGHRRNMLGSYYNAIGIACVEVEGVQFWAMELGYAATAANPGTAFDGSKSVSVEILKEKVSSPKLMVQPTSLSLLTGKSAALPRCIQGYEVATENEENGTWNWGGLIFGRGGSPSWSSSNSSIVRISGSNVVGVNRGSTTLIVSNFGETLSVPVAVKTDINGLSIVQSYNSRPYDFTSSIPEITVKEGNKTLIENTDYSISRVYVSGQSFGDVGTHQLIMRGQGDFGGEKTLSYTVTKLSLDTARVGGVNATYAYEGNAVAPVPYVSIPISNQSGNYNYALTKDRDYTVSYKNNTQIGTATLTITGINNFSGVKSVTYEIKPASYFKDISSDQFGFSSLWNAVYTGEPITPSVTVVMVNSPYTTLVKDEDYTLEYSNNIEVGTATVKVIGIGEYNGTKVLNFEIVPKPISGISSISYSTPTYTGNPVYPHFRLQDKSYVLVEGKDYEVVYKNNINAGTATAVFTGKGHYGSTMTRTFTIYKASLRYADYFTIPDQTYNGLALYPTFTVSYNGKILLKDKDYTVRYFDNSSPGVGYALISGIGNYTDAITKYFKIESTSNENNTGNSSGTINNPSTNQTQVMYRLYNKSSMEHLYTNDQNEIKVLTTMKNTNWKNEGRAWIAPTTSKTPVYRLHNYVSGEHHYTKDANEVRVLCNTKGLT